MLKRLLGYGFVAAALVVSVLLTDARDPGSWRVAAACMFGLVLGDVIFGTWGRRKRE